MYVPMRVHVCVCAYGCNLCICMDDDGSNSAFKYDVSVCICMYGMCLLNLKKNTDR